ncbi:hypothetical protein VTN00DRAFT_3896 [Thermoascus crustaceus]|uniref:uncharacterized protein n=1 Tax=Thermoascus crustaceus TaxID=5088 RepID=UPI0037448DA6
MHYNRHRKTHDKPYRCVLCPKGFALRSDLDRHRRTNLLWHLKPRYTCPYAYANANTRHRGLFRRKDIFLLHIEKCHFPSETMYASPADFEKAQEEFTRACEKFVQEVEDPLRKKEEEVQLAFIEAAASGDESTLREFLNPEKEMVPFIIELKEEALLWAQEWEIN